ncbi:DUF927 domain-containing protein [Clostridioides difficile]|nr:DUF927 domain-containing protein [Clostridioides difficile]
MTDIKTNIRFEEVSLGEDGVYLEGDNGIMKISEPIWIENKARNIDTGEINLILRYEYCGQTEELTLKRDQCLDCNSLIKFQKFGLDIHHFNKFEIIKHLLNEETIAEMINTHSKIGFGEHEGELIYKGYNCIGTKSIYTGNFDIEPKGKKYEWLTMFENEVLGNKNLELICSISLTSLLIGLIGDEYSLETLILHLVGNSTTGKSTALRLAISIFGSVKLSNNSLFSTYNTTHNAMMKRMAGTKGVTFAFDEISISNIGNFSQTIYTLSQGVDKARLNKNSEQKEQETWLGVILSNGEKSLLNSSNKNVGIQMRVVEIENISWTSSAENAEEINKIVASNNGHIAIEVAQHMMELGKEEVSKRYEQNVEMIKKVMNNNKLVDEFTSRRANKIATITTTAKIFEEYLSKELGKEIKLDIEGMLKILLTVEKESIKSRNLDKSAIEYICQYIIDNQHKFEKSWKERPKGEIIGKLRKKKDYLELEMTESKFGEMLNEGGYESKKVVLKELKNKGILDCDDDRYTRKRITDSGIKAPVIVIKFPRKEN